MLQLDRQKQILDYLKKNRKATTNELSELLGVSTTTIRTDLNQMDKDCLLKKTHGGAVYHTILMRGRWRTKKKRKK